MHYDNFKIIKRTTLKFYNNLKHPANLPKLYTYCNFWQIKIKTQTSKVETFNSI